MKKVIIAIVLVYVVLSSIGDIRDYAEQKKDTEERTRIIMEENERLRKEIMQLRNGSQTETLNPDFAYVGLKIGGDVNSSDGQAYFWMGEEVSEKEFKELVEIYK